MSTGNRDELIQHFTSITECPVDQAARYLEAANWDIATATEIYFGGEGSGAATSGPPQGNTDPSNIDLDDESPFQSAIAESLRDRPNKEPTGDAAKKPGGRSNIATLNTFQKEEDSSDEEGQAFYAGGSEQSGQQIIGPSKGKNVDKKVTKLFEAARKQGAIEADEEEQSASNTRKEKPFAGVGYTLGDERTPSRSIGQTNVPPTAQPSGRPEQVPLRFYSNGFTVGDGELRPFEENREFMEYIKRGEVPPELRNLSAGGRQVEVRLEDHRGEEYRPTAPTFKPFGGAGHMLGSPTPTVTATPSNVKSAMASTTASSSSAPDTGRLEKLAEQQLKTSTSSTTIRLRLPDLSTPLTVPIDLNRTLAELRKFLQENIPSLQSNQFEFIEPPSIKIKREDETKSISAAKLNNATLVVRRL